MARVAPATVVRAGPREACGSRATRVGGAATTMAVLLELRGEVAPRERTILLEALRDQALASFDATHGGLTARLRAALGAVDAGLRRESAGRAGPLVAGATLAATTEDGLLLAQVGPAVAYLSARDAAPQRIPARGPWLRRESLQATDVDGPPPLGGGPASVAGPPIEWSHWPSAPDTRLLLASTAAAGALAREVTAVIFRTPLLRVGEAIETALPAGTSALLLAPAAPPASTIPTPEQGGARAASAAPLGSRSPWLAALQRRVTRRWSDLSAEFDIRGRRTGQTIARGGAKVLLGLFPARMAADRGGADWMRLAATAVIALPVAALLLTGVLLMAERRSTAADPRPQAIDATTDPSVAEPAVDPEAIAAQGISDRAAGITRLDDLTIVAALAGDAEEVRDVVAVGDARYVLNRDRGLVEWIGAGETRTAWRQGAAVGGVVAGAPLDLFWLPAPAGGDGGRATVLDAAGRLWPLTGDQAAVLPPLDDSPWRVVIRAAGYDGRLYLLDRGGRIHRYTPAAGSGAGGVIEMVFSEPPEAWLQAEVDLSSAIDIAIDGEILVLQEDGTIRELQGGGLTDFAVVGMPERMVTPRDLYASPSTDQMLVADSGAGEVLVLGADGAFRARLRLKTQPRSSSQSVAEGRLPDLHAVWWDEAAGRLWLVSGNALYQAAFTGVPPLQP